MLRNIMNSFSNAGTALQAVFSDNRIAAPATAIIVFRTLGYKEQEFAAVAVSFVQWGLTKSLEKLQVAYSLPRIVIPVGATIAAFSLEMYGHIGDKFLGSFLPPPLCGGFIPFPHDTIAEMAYDHARLTALIGLALAINIYKNGNKNAFFPAPTNAASKNPTPALENPKISTPGLGSKKSD